MPRINELSDLRAIAIALLFVAHSNLQLTSPVLAIEVTQWFLSAFFFVAGYLASTAFSKRKESIKDFLLHRFASTYLPFVLIMGFYVIADNIVPYYPVGFLTHASFLSVFDVFSVGQFYMQQFWFIPLLLIFTVLFVLGDKYIKSNVLRFSFLIALFIFNLVNYAFMTPFCFQFNFGFYLLVFAIGYEISKRNLLDRLKKPKILSVFAVVALFTVYFNLFVPVAWDASSISGRFIYYAYRWIENTILSVTTLTLVLSFLAYLRKRFGTSKVYLLVNVLGTCTLYIYLWEGFLSTRISSLLFGTTTYYELAGVFGVSFVIIRIVATTILAYSTLRLHNKIAGFLKTHNTFFRNN